MKDITNEQLFLAVVEMGSFKAVAESLGTDPSLVSRRVSNLEARLKIKLIERSTKRSTPTEAGSDYFQGLRKIVEDQQALEQSVTGRVNCPSGHLKVAAPHDFGTAFVSGVLEEMVATYPELTVELVLGSRYENLQSQGIDVAVRIGELPNSNLICRRIGSVPRVLVASPEYLQKFGYPQQISDLKEHQFIFYKWSHIHKALQVGDELVMAKGRFVINSVSAIKQLVLNGRGIHLGPLWAFHEELENDTLTRILPEVPLQSYPLHALYASRTYVPAKVRFFIDRMVAHYGDFGFD